MKLLATTVLLSPAASAALAGPVGLDQHHGGIAPANLNADPLGPASIDTAQPFTPAGIKG